MLNRHTVILDANVVICFLVGDIPKSSLRATAVIKNFDCTVPIEVVAEVVYNLQKQYGHTRGEIADKIKGFILLKENLVVESSLVRYACNRYASSKLDFIDCLLDGYAKVKGNPIFTFDGDLKKQLGVKVFNG